MLTCTLSVCSTHVSVRARALTLKLELHYPPNIFDTHTCLSLPTYTLTLTSPQHLPLYLTHLLTYLYKQASSVSSIRVSVRGQGSCLCMCCAREHYTNTLNTNTNRVHSPTYSTKSQPSGRKYTVLYG